MPSLLDLLSQSETWEKFYAYKTSLACPSQFTKELRGFIDTEKYLPVCRRLQDGTPFPLPQKSIISKMSTQKKRTVYTYPHAENTVLKLLTYLLLRRYDSLFCDNLFSFRPGKSAKTALHKLQRIPGLSHKYSYKVDVSNYFNSIPVEKLLPELARVTADDPALYSFLKALLEEPYVSEQCHPVSKMLRENPQANSATSLHISRNNDYDAEISPSKLRAIREQKGIMAGTPLASFYANLYLRDLDQLFFDQGIPYARYSDDIIVFGDSMEEVQRHADTIRSFLHAKELTVNPSKEEFRTPEEGFVFLGFFQKGKTIDIAPASVKKLKQKMRRKARALQRWQKRNGLTGEKSARAFIRIFNRKLMESSGDNDLTWSYWYFSVINTSESLHVIDLYAQECIRFLLTGTHSKSRYNARYEDLKRLGYQSLVHAYYSSELQP